MITKQYTSNKKMYLYILLFIFISKINCMPIKRQGINVIYYVPHQDDEALGFSLAIAEDIALGNNVNVVIYMPKRSDDGLLKIMNGEKDCPLVENYPNNWKGHNKKHDYNWNMEKIIDIRQKEFMRTLLKLGVNKKNIKSTGWGDERDNVSSDKSQRKLVPDMYNLIANNERTNPNSIHKCIAGPKDCYIWDNPPKPMIDHIACWSAAKQLIVNNNIHKLNFKNNQFLFYDNYIWFAQDDNTHYAFTQTPTIEAPMYKINLSKYKKARTDTHNIYREWDPKNEKYALGYHSVHNLFYGSEHDYNVYLEPINTINNDLSSIYYYDNGNIKEYYPPGLCLNKKMGDLKE